MSNNIDTKTKHQFPNLSQCKDFDILINNFSIFTLLMFEQSLTRYLDENKFDEDNVPFIVCWYEGMVTTDDLIEHYNNC